MLKVEDLTVRYGGLTILDRASFSVEENRWLMVVGPNGAGKSTLVGAVSQSVPHSGRVLFQGEDVARLRPAQLARRMGVVMQNHHVGYSFTVEEVVRLGRYAYSAGLFAGHSDEDAARVEEALAATGLAGLRGQSVLTLSGGELQRTFLAQVLAQDPRLLLLDEPTNHLDLVYQRQVFQLVGEWLRRPGRAVVSVVHDLSLAKAYGTHALLLHQGRVAAEGPIDQVLTGDVLNPVYGMDVPTWMRELLTIWQP